MEIIKVILFAIRNLRELSSKLGKILPFLLEMVAYTLRVVDDAGEMESEVSQHEEVLLLCWVAQDTKDSPKGPQLHKQSRQFLEGTTPLRPSL
jgi:hypothetical protein